MRLTPRPWAPRPGGGCAGGAELAADPAAAPLVLAIDRADPAVRRALPELPPLLSVAERTRMESHRRPEDRERFLLGRAGLRLGLAAVLARDPRSLTFAAGPHGKPFLEGGAGAPDPAAPQFNLSHAGDLILLALHRWRAVGVDVERERPGLDWRPIARRCLSPPTRRRLEALAAEAQGAAFLQAWCELEAILKAAGTGLGGEPPTQPATLWVLALPGGYRGAAALL
ncbi:MAG: 4'-phosphopantetheinyl transferase superfamily protein [Synechococcaceae cyanobacterium]|nr:4'-phosphopantetheinyl transferase superfamily protein [Synechococcaceae cyanobacterium]